MKKGSIVTPPPRNFQFPIQPVKLKKRRADDFQSKTN